MNVLWVLIFMILCHIIDDFVLQGWLASAKQENWWKKQEGYNDLYKNDYKMALFIHSLEWSIMIHLPIIVFYNFQVTIGILISILGNCYLHYLIDDLKANLKVFTLIIDQIFHIIEVILFWAIFCIVLI